MAGHLFTICADITRLHCDAWLLPTDRSGWIERSWLKRGPHQSSEPTRLPMTTEEKARLSWGEPTPLDAWPEAPRPYLVPVGQWNSTDTASYLDHARKGLDVAAKDAHTGPADSRERPLFALPVLGIRAGGITESAGALISDLVAGLKTYIATHPDDFDVALVAYHRDAFAACQQVRRRLEATAPSRTPEINKLTAAANKGELVIFVGAGASASVGVPDWATLLDNLARRAGYDDKERKALQNVDPLDRARLVSDRFKSRRTTLGKHVAKETRRERYGLIHSQLACLPVQEITTTNYDQLFEFAAKDARDPVKVLPYERLDEVRRWLLKLHGSVDHRRDIVLTREDYYDYAGRRGALRGIVQALLITRHMLFVGFSLQDDNFLRIAHEVRTAVRQPKRDAVAHPYGTVLTLFEDSLSAELWREDLKVWPVGGKPPKGKAPFRRALLANARKQEILLDELLVRSTTSAGYLLDPRFAGALDDSEERARELLEDLAAAAAHAPTDSPTWTQIRSLLAGFGAGPTGHTQPGARLRVCGEGSVRGTPDGLSESPPADTRR